MGYWTVYQGIFRDPSDHPPIHWQWRLVSPLFVASLTPLVLSGTPVGGQNVVLLAFSAGGGFLLVFTLMTVLTLGEVNEKDPHTKGRFFFSLRRPVVLSGWTMDGLTWAKALFVAGLIVIFGFAGLSLWIAGQRV
ncbi:hypothetical protein [Actinoplanes awajinensis]|uniref:hypothetical protein n=1 Tax=Actinoplanes awajinensis TaxID=135946 RepID=UPI0012FAA8D4|nr:hypothetical protein [Actinoplanes awajinensis]